ncbi:succinate dehydrogenase, cytochrome b556 subunit [Allopusillimonas ginsengisoli]|uniref:succinate dehydrogenase, cytochrome b556 subunit n=1 Tax=Allopusillimonas ginsengisoli TaxID=453575 RepID=UPI00101FD2A8|nr:succinate dehydrogenase, cytochrome b556 subunit [Allopusillimonas ginsengisoli]TEA77896.1 succinate dehydrogenase, cytochrome b556 subunit [Allopusillimonas ginsengisoli]
MKRNDFRARSHASWIAFCIHRISGILLTLFLPIHFWTLGLALEGEASLDSALRWYEAPVFKFGEWALVFLLAAHALGGLRILLIEFRPWRGLRRGWIAASLGTALAVSVVFIVAALN